jgi:radical SAM protein with 4Fe4S-binding SPASM domain
VDIAREYGISKLRFIMAMDTVGTDFADEKLNSKMTEIRGLQIDDYEIEDKLHSELGLKCEEAGIEWSFQGSAPLAPECWWPRRGVFVTYEGYITPCCIRMDPSLISFGNIYEQPFKEIWNSEGYSCFRKRFEEGSVPGICRRCPK